MNIEDIKTKVIFHDTTMKLTDENFDIIRHRVYLFGRAMLKKRQSNSFYKERRNTVSDKKTAEDNVYGKLSEWFIALLFRKWGFPRLYPGDEVREGYEKGWEVDLPFSEKDSTFPDCHLKNTATRYNGEFSWTFQLKDNRGNGGRDPLFDNKNSTDLVVMTNVAGLTNYGRLCYTAPWNVIYPRLRDPNMERYKGLKKCIYERELKELIEEGIAV